MTRSELVRSAGNLVTVRLACVAFAFAVRPSGGTAQQPTQPASASRPAFSPSQLEHRALYRSRFGAEKEAALQLTGGIASYPSVVAGLEWLKKHQDEDGRWSAAGFMRHDPAEPRCDGAGNATNDVGVTGLALLAFLGDGNTLREGPHAGAVRKGVAWLQSQQADDGLFGTKASAEAAYNHAIATLAVCEAYGLSPNARLEKSAQKAVDYIVAARNPFKAWRYFPRDGDNDTSVTAWMVLALKSAEEFQLTVDPDACKCALMWFDQVTERTTGAAGYTKRGEGSSRKEAMQRKFPNNRTECMTAAVLLCRAFLGQTPKDPGVGPVMAAAAATLLKKPPVWSEPDGSIDLCYWYYGSHALLQIGGEHWRQWNAKLQDAAVPTQRKDGNFTGSWDPKDPWQEDGGRVYSTALLVLCLEAGYRYGKAPAAGGAMDPALGEWQLGAGGTFGARFGKGKENALRSGGVTTADAVQQGLEWLRSHMEEDGHWDSAGFMRRDVDGKPSDGPGNGVNDIGVTGLALLAFLAEGNTLKTGPDKDVVRKTVKWLRDQQAKEGPDNGLFGTTASHEFIYNHALATLAMCEAYGLSDYAPLKGSAQSAIDYVQRARNPYKVWRYVPRDGNNDTSVTAWMVLALKSAEEFKLSVDKDAFTAALLWFDQVTDPATGVAGYTKRGEGSSRKEGMALKFPTAKSECLTAAALLCRVFLGQTPKDPKSGPVMTAAAASILKKPPVWNETDGSIDMGYWYYGTYALFQMGGDQWQQWSAKLRDAVVKTQRKDGNFKGSWDPVDPWGKDGGRVYATALLVLCLQAQYRYARLLR